MAVAAPPQRIVTSPGRGIVLNGDARPVMDGILQPFVAGKAADHEALFAAAPGHRSRACQGPQGVVIPCTQRLCRLGEQRGEDDPADSRPGAKDRHVMLLTVLPRRALRRCFEPGREAVQSLMRFLSEGSGVRDRGLVHPSDPISDPRSLTPDMLFPYVHPLVIANLEQADVLSREVTRMALHLHMRPENEARVDV